MAETLNVNVLVAAKEEYSKQLINSIRTDVYDIVLSIFEDSQKNNIRRELSLSNFQIELKAVPNWTETKLVEKIKRLTDTSPFLMDLVTAIFVSHVKILTSVRLKTDDKSIKIKVPNLNLFLHKIIIGISEKIYYNPHCILGDKVEILTEIDQTILETISNQIPIEYILNEYLSGAFEEPETKYPDTTDIMENNEEEDDPVSEEEEFVEESKEIPIVPISRPLHTKTFENINDDKSQNTDENTLDTNENTLDTNENTNEIEDINELNKIDKDSEISVNKKTDISDSESESDSDDEEPEQNTLF